MNTKRTFTQEFKTETAKLVTEQGYKIAEAAKIADINPSLMAKWVRKLRENTNPSFAFPGKGNLNPHDSENAELRKQLQKVSRERDILKKAIQYFTQEPE